MSGRRAKEQRRAQGGAGGPPAAGRGLSRGWTWALVLVVVAGFGAFVLEPVWRPLLAPAPAPEVLAAEGARVYREHCATCHGPGAEGQVPAQHMGGRRADGTYIAPALNGTAHAWHHAPEALFRIVKTGSPAADSPMRGFAERLSDREIEAVLVWLQSLWPERLRARYRTMHDRG